MKSTSMNLSYFVIRIYNLKYKKQKSREQMKEILKKLENNFNLMERNESPLKLNCLNLSGIKNSFSLKSILNSKIKKINNSNSSRETKLNATFTKNTKKKKKQRV